MVHGGPYPSTSDGRSTSVGTQAIFRFTRLVCYQGFPDHALPDEMKEANPLGIWRLIDGNLRKKKRCPPEMEVAWIHKKTFAQLCTRGAAMVNAVLCVSRSRVTKNLLQACLSACLIVPLQAAAGDENTAPLAERQTVK